MFLQRHKIKKNWTPEFLSSCEAEEFNNFQSIIFEDEQDFNKRKYLALEKTWKLLSKMDCPVFVTGGTLLGIIRDNKLIDWDDDIENSSHDRFKEVVIKSRLDDFIDNLPEGLDTRMGERGVRLSGGQRQRVAIARALFHEREVLILDEATSSLDMKNEEEIVKQMQKFKGEKTVITIAHRISSLKYCDSLYKLEKGTISGPYTYDDFLLTLEDKSLV